MVLPCIQPGVENMHGHIGDRVNSGCFLPFQAVAERAGVSEVFYVVGAILHYWDDVVYGKKYRGKPILTFAIFATMTRPKHNLKADCFRD